MSNNSTEMNHSAVEEEDEGEVFLDESDVLYEEIVDEEDPYDNDMDDEADDNDMDDDGEQFDENDDDTDHKGELYALACSPTDATLFATGGGDDKAFLWKIGNGDWWSVELQGHEDSVSTLAFSYDGQLIASGGFDGVVQIFDASSGSLKCVLGGPAAGIEWVRWHPRGHIVLAGSQDCSLWMWNADNGAYPNMFSGHNLKVTCGDFTPDGKLICTGSNDASLIVWNPKTCESIHVVKGHPYHTKGLTCLDINSNSSLAISGSKDGSVHIVNIVTGMVVSSLSYHTKSVECVKFSPSSATIPLAATGATDNKLIIWDLQHSTPRFICDHAGSVTCLTWIGTSKYLATGCADGTVSVWDSLLGNCVRTFHGHKYCVQAISVTANLNFIVSVSLDKTATPGVYETSEFQKKVT